jgi:hypothetical protein
MKPVHPILKIVTLFIFITLISGFVAYRAGALNGIVHGDRTSVDSPGTDSVKSAPTMMSSSKSTIMIEPDTNKNKPKPRSSTRPKPVIMPSSKSGPVFVPDQDTVKEAP